MSVQALMMVLMIWIYSSITAEIAVNYHLLLVKSIIRLGKTKILFCRPDQPRFFILGVY